MTVSADLLAALNPFLDQVRAGLNDAAAIVGAVRGLPGAVGRYNLGSRFTVQPTVSTASESLQSATTAATSISAICDALHDLAAVGAASDVIDGVQPLVDSVAGSNSDPAAAIVTLTALAQYQPPNGAGNIGQAIAARCRQASLIALCETSRVYYLTSFTEAVELLSEIAALIDAEVEWCGTAFWDATLQALLRLKAALVADLLARGGSLAPLRNYGFKASLPACVVAQQLYADGSRDGEIVDRVDPVHAGFMPVDMVLLAR